MDEAGQVGLPDVRRAGRWSWRSSIREAWRAIAAWGGRAQIMLLCAVLGGAVVGGYQALQWDGVLANLRTQALLGRNVITIGPQDIDNKDFTVSIASCEALSRYPEVQRVGVVLPLQTTDITQLGPHVPMVAGSRTLFTGLSRADSVVGSVLAAQVELFPGEQLRLRDARLGTFSSVIAKPQPTGIDTNGSLVVAVDPAVRSAGTCIIELADLVDARAAAYHLSGSVRAQGGAAAVYPAAHLTFDVVEDFLERPERYAPILLGLLGGLVAGAFHWFRSSEIAAYRLSGTTSSDFFRIAMIEQLITSGAMMVSMALSLLVVRSAGIGVVSGTLWTYLGGLAWITSFGVVLLLVLARNPMKLAKDR